MPQVSPERKLKLLVDSRAPTVCWVLWHACFSKFCLAGSMGEGTLRPEMGGEGWKVLASRLAGSASETGGLSVDYDMFI